MKRNVKIMATGGGAHKFYQDLHAALGIEVRREEEMECLVLGLSFVMEIPNEVFWYSDELIQAVSHPQQRALSAVTIPSTPGSSATPLPLLPSEFDDLMDAPAPPILRQPPATSVGKALGSITTSAKSTPGHSARSSVSSLAVPSASDGASAAAPPLVSPSAEDLPRPSPNPPQYSLKFDSSPTPAQFPCLLVNIGSGVSIVKIDDYGKFERISGTSLGGGTLWGLLSLLTGAKSFDGTLCHQTSRIRLNCEFQGS